MAQLAKASRYGIGKIGVQRIFKYKSNTNNIMSYTKNRECRNNFTEEQIALMLYKASTNKNAKYWTTDKKDADNYIFDYFEPDNTKQILIDTIINTQKVKQLKIYAIVIMHNHFHIIYSSCNPAKEIGKLKSFSARQIIQYYRNTPRWLHLHWCF